MTINHQENANQNQWNIISCHLKWQLSKRQEVRNAGIDMERREHTFIAGGNGNWHSHYRKQYKISSKQLKIKLSYNTTIPLQGMYPKN